MNKKSYVVCVFYSTFASMSRGKSSETKTPEFRIQNTNMRLKRECVSIAKSEGKTISQWAREKLIAIAASYPDSARKYQEDDDCC